jgi:hypothetical protein
MKTKVGAKASLDGSIKIGSGSDACGSKLKEGVEVLLARSDGHSEDLTAPVKVPKQWITHIN